MWHFILFFIKYSMRNKEMETYELLYYFVVFLTVRSEWIGLQQSCIEFEGE